MELLPQAGLATGVGVGGGGGGGGGRGVVVGVACGRPKLSVAPGGPSSSISSDINYGIIFIIMTSSSNAHCTRVTSNPSLSIANTAVAVQRARLLS